MKKLILLASIFTFGFVYSQKKDAKKLEPKTKEVKPSPYFKLDSISTNIATEKRNQSGFYKNVDSAKASKYKMLNKKPSGQYMELSQEKLHQIDKSKDSVLFKKKKK